jgi:hypothetical protein
MNLIQTHLLLRAPLPSPLPCLRRSGFAQAGRWGEGWGEGKFHPPTQETTALAVEECVAQDRDFPTYPSLASADFAAGRMTRRSLGCCVPNRISVHWRSRVWLLGTTGLPVGLH